jgi:hypothetical protein
LAKKKIVIGQATSQSGKYPASQATAHPVLSMMTDVDDDGWTDEEDNHKRVKEANRVPLSELKDVIESAVPSLSLTASNRYFSQAKGSNSATRTTFLCTIPKRFPK